MKNFIKVRDLDLAATQIIDVQIVLGDKEESKKLYEKGHIPGAVFANLETDLSGEITEKSGRHPLPKTDDFLNYLRRIGLTKSQPVVVYDNFNGGVAARLWWMLRFFGWENVKILEGGIHRWIENGGRISTKNVTSFGNIDSLSAPVSWQDGSLPVISMDQVLQHTRIVDSRDKERYEGSTGGPDPVAGKIPGAINWHWANNLEENGELRELEQLRHKLDTIVADEALFYCGSGVTACFNIAVIDELGKGIMPLYPGSWSEWSRNNSIRD